MSHEKGGGDFEAVDSELVFGKIQEGLDELKLENKRAYCMVLEILFANEFAPPGFKRIKTKYGYIDSGYKLKHFTIEEFCFLRDFVLALFRKDYLGAMIVKMELDVKKIIVPEEYLMILEELDVDSQKCSDLIYSIREKLQKLSQGDDVLVSLEKDVWSFCKENFSMPEDLLAALRRVVRDFVLLFELEFVKKTEG